MPRASTPQRRSPPGWLLALSAAALLGACSPASTDSLHFGGLSEPTPLGLNLDLPTGRSGQSVGAFSLCLDQPGTARVTEVDFEQAQGVRITSWSVREGQQYGLGSSPKDLAAEGFPERPVGISVVCGGDAGQDVGSYPSELGIRLELAGARGTASVLRVRYTLGERAGVVSIPFSVEMSSV